MSIDNSTEIIERSFNAICEVFEKLREQDYTINQKNNEIIEKTNNLERLITQNTELKDEVNQLSNELVQLKDEFDNRVNILSIDINEIINNTQKCIDILDSIHLFKLNIIDGIKNIKYNLTYNQLLDIFTTISKVFPEFGDYKRYIEELNLYCSDIMNYTLYKYILVIKIRKLLPDWLLEISVVDNMLNKILYDDLDKVYNLDLKINSYDEFTQILGDLYAVKEDIKPIFFQLVEKINKVFSRIPQETRNKYAEYTYKIDDLVVGTVKIIDDNFVYVELEEDVEGVISIEDNNSYSNYIENGVIAGYIGDVMIEDDRVLVNLLRPKVSLLKIALLESMYVYGVDNIRIHCIEESEDTSYIIVNGIENKEKVSYVKKYLEGVLLLNKELNFVNYSSNCVEYFTDLLKIDTKRVNVQEKQNKIFIKGKEKDINEIEYKLSKNRKVIDKLIDKELVIEKNNYRDLYNSYLKKQGKYIHGKIVEVKSNLAFIDVGDDAKVTLRQEDCFHELNKYKKGDKINGEVISVSLSDDGVNVRVSVKDAIEYNTIKDLSDIKNGDLIIHNKYGKGKVIKKIGSMMSVRFEKNAIKILNIEESIKEASIKKM